MTINDTDPRKQTTLGSFDVDGHLHLRTLPGGQSTIHIYKNGLEVQIKDPDGHTQGWVKDFFNRASDHTLLDGTHVTIARDHTGRPTHQRSSGGRPRQYLHATRKLTARGERVYLRYLPVPPQDIAFLYSAGLLFATVDHAFGKRSTRGYNRNHHCVQRHLASDDGLLRDMRLTLDAKGRPQSYFDTSVHVHPEYDPNDNVVHSRTTFQGKSSETWNHVDDAGRLLLNKGIKLPNQTIGVAPGQGTLVRYQANNRASESMIPAGSTELVTTSITLDKDGEVWKTHSSTAQVPTIATTQRDKSADDQYVKQFTQTTVSGGKTQTLVHTLTCNPNTWVTHDEQRKNNVSEQTTTISGKSGYTGLGNVRAATTQVPSSQGPLTFTLAYSYEHFETECVSFVGGTTHDRHGSAYIKPARMFYGPNRHPQSKIGMDDNIGKHFGATVLFHTDTEGVPLMSEHVHAPGVGAALVAREVSLKEQLFVSPSGMVLASYTLDSDPRSQSNKVHHSVVDHASPYGKQRGGVRAAALSQLGRHTPQGLHAHFEVASAFMRVMEHVTPVSYRDYLSYVGGKNPRESFQHYVPSPMSSYPPLMRRHYTVPRSGMRMAEVSQAVYGTPRQAQQIALANGLSLQSSLQQGESLRIPAMQFNYANLVDNPHYSHFMQIMIGGLSPHLVFAHKHRSCIETVVEIVISVVAVVVANMIVPGGGFAAFMESGLLAAGIDAGLQGVALEIGLIHEFSWGDVFGAFLQGGAAHELGSAYQSFKTAASASELTDKALQTMMLDMLEVMSIEGGIVLAEQLRLLAVGQLKKIDFKAVFVAMLSAALDLGLSPKLAPTTRPVEHEAERLALDFAEQLIGDAIYGVPPRLEDLFAKALGEGIGQLVTGTSPFTQRHNAGSASQHDGRATRAAQPHGHMNRHYQAGLLAAHGKSAQMTHTGLDHDPTDAHLHATHHAHHSVRSSSNKPLASTNQHTGHLYHYTKSDVSNLESHAGSVHQAAHHRHTAAAHQALTQENFSKTLEQTLLGYMTTKTLTELYHMGLVLYALAAPASPSQSRVKAASHHRVTHGKYSLWSRVALGVSGTAMGIGAALSGAAAVLTSESVVGAAFFGTTAVYEADQAQSALHAAWTGYSNEPLMDQGLESMGISTGVAHRTDLVVGLGLALPSLVVSGARLLGKVGLFKGGVAGAEKLVIHASSPSQIAWGYGKLSSRQAKLLDSLSQPGRFTQLHKSYVSATDLAALTAHTGDEFGLFTLGSRRIIVRGTSKQLLFDPPLENKLLSRGWKWSGHVHPGTLDRVLMSSGADRSTLQVFNQERSLILNSAGRRSIFDLTDDYAITNELNYESSFRLEGY